MGRSSRVFLLLLLTLASFAATIHGRKLKQSMQVEQQAYPPPPPPPSLESLYLASLPKGKVANSAPSKQHHSFVVDEKLIARHLAALDRILRSVPSPGVGH